MPHTWASSNENYLKSIFGSVSYCVVILRTISLAGQLERRHLSNRPHFLLVYWCNKPTRDVGRTREKLVNHEPQASDLQAFRVFSQHPKWVYYTSKPIENAVYCFYEITRKKTKF